MDASFCKVVAYVKKTTGKDSSKEKPGNDQ